MHHCVDWAARESLVPIDSRCAQPFAPRCAAKHGGRSEPRPPLPRWQQRDSRHVLLDMGFDTVKIHDWRLRRASRPAKHVFGAMLLSLTHQRFM
eukprot:6202422-Pleurochrysis_carterae.AAC.4